MSEESRTILSNVLKYQINIYEIARKRLNDRMAKLGLKPTSGKGYTTENG